MCIRDRPAAGAAAAARVLAAGDSAGVVRDERCDAVDDGNRVGYSDDGRNFYGASTAGTGHAEASMRPCLLYTSTRRRLLGALVAAPLLGPAAGLAQPVRPATRAIPSSGEAIPLVGLGTWLTFNVGNDLAARNASSDVMRAFFAAGGRLIDSSPMYGSAQEVIGYGLARLGRPADVFSADKVWLSDGDQGRTQMDTSRRLWGVPRFDLMQVHNLLSWEAHLPTPVSYTHLDVYKRQGKTRSRIG